MQQLLYPVVWAVGSYSDTWLDLSFGKTTGKLSRVWDSDRVESGNLAAMLTVVAFVATARFLHSVTLIMPPRFLPT